MNTWFYKIKDKFKSNRELKALFILGVISLIHIIINIFVNEVEINPIDVVIRSQVIGIFGYIFGVQSKCEISYYDKDLQFFTAFLVAFLCLITLMVARWMGMTNSIPALSSLRDLMSTAIGFMIGQSKNDNV